MAAPGRGGLPRAAWYEVRRAQSRKPATYTCPVCGGLLPAMTPHALVSPEGDTTRRRHTHLRCVVAERKAGRLPTRDDARGPRPSWLAKLKEGLSLFK